MSSIKISKAKNAVTLIKQAVEIRAKITELYVQYRFLSSTACKAAMLSHNDLKRAVDAIYYLGGGWPSENSKGRMEALLDNFVGMYRILDFIGSGNLVIDHLAKSGVSVKLDPKFMIKDKELTQNDIQYLKKEFGTQLDTNKIKTLKDLVTEVVLECDNIQGKICNLADRIKGNLRPAAMKELNIVDPEFDRLFDLAKTKVKDTPTSEESVIKKKSKIHESVSGYNAASVLF